MFFLNWFYLTVFLNCFFTVFFYFFTLFLLTSDLKNISFVLSRFTLAASFFSRLWSSSPAKLHVAGEVTSSRQAAQRLPLLFDAFPYKHASSSLQNPSCDRWPSWEAAATSFWPASISPATVFFIIVASLFPRRPFISLLTGDDLDFGELSEDVRWCFTRDGDGVNGEQRR